MSAGLGCFSVSFLVSLYYNTVLLWVLWFFLNSFQHPLPWSTCPLDLNRTGESPLGCGDSMCGTGTAADQATGHMLRSLSCRAHLKSSPSPLLLASDYPQSPEPSGQIGSERPLVSLEPSILPWSPKRNKKGLLGNEEINQSAKCLPHKHEDLSLIPRTHVVCCGASLYFQY